MPFTLTHVAAVVPIKRASGAALPFTALVIGSMVPDIPMFVGVGQYYAQTHSLAGLLTTCLPIGLVVYVLFQMLFRYPMLELLPNAFGDRLGARQPHTPRYLLGVTLAVLIGAATHVLWDSFTHGYGWGVKLLPPLHNTFILFDRSHGYYKLLQHGSSVVFLPLLAWWLWRWAQSEYEPPRRAFQRQLNLPVWLKLCGCFAVFAMPALYALTEAWLQTHSFYYGIGQAARAYGRYLFFAALSASMLIRLCIWQKRAADLQRGASN